MAAMAKSLISLIFLLFIFFAATEARTCLSQSQKYKGPCLRRSNCANVCRTEGFPGGECRGFRRRCFCAKNC
uniref:Defensin 3 n=1 Tax=Allium sativum TaxID=4682 RepID=A0A7D5T120_ALLSA|nr:defensin 3 [Allium sativum]QLH55380.1 defensin 3 [Allium sativum]